MPKKEVVWYELIGKTGDAPQLLLQNEFYSGVSSLEETAAVVISCPVPMVKFYWEILSPDRKKVLEGSWDFGSEGVERFSLGSVLPMEQLLPYETETAEYCMKTGVILATGDDVNGSFVFRSHLHKGKAATEIFGKNLPTLLAEIPIANASMTEDQLRQICLDYMKLEQEVPFRMPKDFFYTVESQKRRRRLVAGQVYGGIPYVTRGAGNLYRFAELYDPETDTLRMDSDIYDDIRYFGNACSGSASMAWARVVTSAYLGYTMFMTEANGFLPVGNYKYPAENMTRFIPGSNGCRTLCDFNGEEVMYESYAKMKPADGLVCDGHVRMNSRYPEVVRRDDGTIDPDQSYIWTRDQNCYMGTHNNVRLLPDGTHYSAQGFVDIRFTFRSVFNRRFVPFTFREFANPALVEPARIRLAVEPELRERVLTANYPISDIFLELDGQRWSYRNMEFFRKEVKLGDIFPAEALTPETKIYCQLMNGQLLEVPQ